MYQKEATSLWCDARIRIVGMAAGSITTASASFRHQMILQTGGVLTTVVLLKLQPSVAATKCERHLASSMPMPTALEALHFTCRVSA